MKISDDIKRYALKRRLLLTGLCLLTMSGFSLIFFANLDTILNSEYAKIRITIYIIMTLLPILFFRIPQLLFEKSFKGTIVDIDIIAIAEGDVRRGFLEALYKKVRVNAVIELSNKKIIHRDIASRKTQRLSVPSKFQRNANDSFLAEQYKIGDTVVHIAGTKYYQVYSKAKNELICVICGSFSDSANEKCEHCGHNLQLISE